MQKDVKPCRGCICTGCAKSEYNGAMYLCPTKACNMCEKATYIVKRSCCYDCVPLDEDDADDFRL